MQTEDLPFQPREIQRFLNLLGYNSNESVYLRAIKSEVGNAQKIQSKDVASIPLKRLISLQEDGFNLYIVVNGGGHKDADVKSCRAIFYEHDNLSKVVQRDLWKSLKLPEPTVQVNTGGKSIHSYWVFEEPIAPEQWRQLQSDLLEFSDGDRTIKNPSRVMRLPGCIHQGTQKLSAIISSAGKRYSYEWMRSLIPSPSVIQPKPSMVSTQSITATPTQSIATTSSIISTQPIPLENCLTKEHRSFLAGISEGGRNNAGAALARDLIGTSARLEYLGISYGDSPRTLFDEFCSQCNPPLNTREAEYIWKSALKANPTACLTDDAIENCVKSWERSQKIPLPIPNPQSPIPNPQSPIPNPQSPIPNSPNARTDNGGNLDSGNGGGTGTGDIPPDSSPDPDEVFRLEVLAYSDEQNPFKKLRLKGNICACYRISTKELERLVDEIKGRSAAPKSKRHTGAEFLLLETEGIKWLIPGIIPGRGVTILGGAPGAGKTTIVYDMAASILYQESFLGEDIDRPGKVLFVSSDEQPCFAQDKLINRGFTFNDQWQFVTDWDISQKQEFEEYLDDFRPQFVMVDSFAAIHRDESFDENSSQAKAAVYWLESMANKYGCAILLIHHCNKNREQKGVAKLRGSSAIAGACSAVLLLEGEGNFKSISASKIRGSEPFKWDIRLDPETGRWSVVAGKIDDSATKGLSEKIMLLFSSKYPTARLEVSEIREEVGGQQDAIYKALDRLCKRGLLVKRPSEKNRRFKVYGLPVIAETTLDTILEHTPSTTPVIHTEEIPESHTTVELQTLDATPDICRTTLDKDLEAKTEMLTQKPAQTLDAPQKQVGERVDRIPQVGDRVMQPHHLGINYSTGKIYSVDEFMGEILYRVEIPGEAILSLSLDEVLLMGVELPELNIDDRVYVNCETSEDSSLAKQFAKTRKATISQVFGNEYQIKFNGSLCPWTELFDRSHLDLELSPKPKMNFDDVAPNLREDVEAIVSMIQTACKNSIESVVLDELQMIKEIIASSKQNLPESEVNDFRRVVWNHLSDREKELFKKLSN